jgi:hypothetical protein
MAMDAIDHLHGKVALCGQRRGTRQWGHSAFWHGTLEASI